MSKEQEFNEYFEKRQNRGAIADLLGRLHNKNIVMGMIREHCETRLHGKYLPEYRTILETCTLMSVELKNIAEAFIYASSIPFLYREHAFIKSFSKNRNILESSVPKDDERLRNLIDDFIKECDNLVAFFDPYYWDLYEYARDMNIKWE